MKLSVLVLTLYGSVVSARVLRERELSLLRNRVPPGSTLLDDRTSRKGETQRPLIPEADNSIRDSSRNSATLEIESGSFYGLPFYYTNIALGTPNQAFRVLLDLDYGGLIVRAPGCNAPIFDCGLGFEYNHSASTTYQDEGERFSLHLPAQYVNGNVSTDYMQLVNLNISNVTFGEVDDFHGENLYLIVLEDIVDGAIGFGPPNASAQLYTETEVPNILEHVLTDGVLDRNIMTLSLPYPGERGSLTLGALPDDADEEYIKLPLGNTSVKQTWHVKVDSVSLVGNVSLELPLGNVHAGFELGSGLVFPRNTTDSIVEALNARLEDNFYMPQVNCSRWNELPDLVLKFSGHDVVLPKEDYAVHGYLGPDEICAIDIDSSWFDNDTVALGWRFMQKFHIAFDMEEKQLGLIERNQHRQPAEMHLAQA